MLASSESRLGFERQYNLFRWQGDQLPGKRGALDSKCCVEGALNENEECPINSSEC
jgi:hypothetical protein